MTTNTFQILDQNLKFPHLFLLSASAGSGKTYNLSNRYIQFLLSPNICRKPLSEMLAITFTENASKEMRGRIINFLKEIYFNSSKRAEIKELIDLDDDKLKNKADEVLNFIFANYADFNVGTIDSFIVSVLSVSLNELGIPFDFELVFKNEELINAILPRFFASFKRTEGEKIIDNFLLTMNNSGGDMFFFNPLSEIKKYFSDFMANENKYLLNLKVSSQNLNQILELLKLQEKSIVEKMLDIIKKHSNLRDFYLKGVKEALQKNDYSALIKIYNPRGGFYNSNKSAVKEALKKGLTDELQNVTDLLKEYYRAKSETFYMAFADLYIRFRETFYDLRWKNKVVSLSQITADISRYIKNSFVPEIYLKLAAKLKHFLIDEFQDTNLAQWNIMRPLIEDSLARDGSLFLIGDIKQAIYMFRNADYRIMKDFSDDRPEKYKKYINTDSLIEGIRKFSLDYNYRSGGRIVSWVQDFFASEEFGSYLRDNIGGDPTSLQNSAQQVPPHRKDTGRVKTVVIQAKSDSGEDKLKSIFIENIRDLTSRFQLDQIAVLVKENDEVENVVGWLSEEGIQAVSFSSLDIRKRKVIAELCSLLAFLDNPADNFAFATFILGNVFANAAARNIKIDEFIFNTDSSSQELLYSAFKDKFRDLWDNFFEELFSKSGYLTCYELINLALSRFSVYNNFPEESAFLIKFVNIAYLLNSHKGAATISNLIEKLKNGPSNDEEFSVSIPQSIPAVRVMTFHKAKGLGFGAVVNIFEQQSWQAHGGEKIYYSVGNDGLELRRITTEMAKFLPELNKLKQDRKQEEEIQNLNTLYVALTRAENELINIVRVLSSPKENLQDRSKKGNKRSFPFFKDCEIGEKIKASSQPQDKPQYLEITLASLEKTEIYDFIKNGEIDTFQTIRGNIYHMALAGIEYDVSRNLIEQSVDKACNFYGVVSVDYKQDIVKQIMKAVSHELLNEYFKRKQGRWIKNEVEFISTKGRTYRIDRLVKDEDIVTIIDYKTGDEEDYSAQMKNYMKIVSQALNKPVKGIIYYIDSGKVRLEG